MNIVTFPCDLLVPDGAGEEEEEGDEDEFEIPPISPGEIANAPPEPPERQAEGGPVVEGGEEEGRERDMGEEEGEGEGEGERSGSNSESSYLYGQYI